MGQVDGGDLDAIRSPTMRWMASMVKSLQSAVQIVKDIYAACLEGDIESLNGLIDPSFVAVEAGSLPFGGRYEGPEGFYRLMQRLGETWSALTMSQAEYTAEGNRVIASFSLQGTSSRTGKSLDMQVLEFWRVGDGKAIWCQPFYFDTHQLGQVAGEF